MVRIVERSARFSYIEKKAQFWSHRILSALVVKNLIAPSRIVIITFEYYKYLKLIPHSNIQHFTCRARHNYICQLYLKL